MDSSYLLVQSVSGRTGWQIVLMSHHAKSGGSATPGAIKIALDSGVIDLLFIGDMVIHRHLLLKKPVVLMRIVKALLIYLDIVSVEQVEAVLEKAPVFLIRSTSTIPPTVAGFSCQNSKLMVIPSLCIVITRRPALPLSIIHHPTIGEYALP